VSTSRIAGTADPRRSGASTGVSGSANFAPVVKPEEFIRLAQPSAKDGINYAEAIVHLARARCHAPRAAMARPSALTEPASHVALAIHRSCRADRLLAFARYLVSDARRGPRRFLVDVSLRMEMAMSGEGENSADRAEEQRDEQKQSEEQQTGCVNVKSVSSGRPCRSKAKSNRPPKSGNAAVVVRWRGSGGRR